jgi:hypothetical protein
VAELPLKGLPLGRCSHVNAPCRKVADYGELSKPGVTSWVIPLRTKTTFSN